MATTRWRPARLAAAQVSTVQITANDAGTTYRLASSNGNVVSVTGAGTAALTATALAAAWNAAGGEFTEATAAANSDVVTLTWDVEGKAPFTITSSVTGGAGTIGAAASVTAAAGPNFWDDAINWSGGAVPVNGDVVHVDGDGDVLFGLAQTAVTLAELHVPAAYTDRVGLPEVDPAGYPQPLAKYLAIKSTLVTVGKGEGQGTPRLLLDNSTAQATVTVWGTGLSDDAPLPAMRWKGTHASNAMSVMKGDVGVAVLAGEAATLASLYVGYVSSPQSDASVKAGAGLTLTALTQSGGTVTLEGDCGMVLQTGGTLEVAGDCGAVTSRGGVVRLLGGGTLAATTLGSGGTLDLSRASGAVTLTADLTLERGAVVFDPNGKLAFAGFDVVFADGVSLGDVSVNLGPGRTLSPA
jgi:hypothetical protein